MNTDLIKKEEMQAKRLANYNEEKELLSVEKTENGSFFVSSANTTGSYEVEEIAGSYTCSCPDYVYRCKEYGINCKHILSVIASTGKSLPVVQVEAVSTTVAKSVLLSKYAKTADEKTAVEYIHRSIGGQKAWETRKKNEARKQTESNMTKEEKMKALFARW